MGISRFKYLLALAAVFVSVPLCSADDAKPAEPISAADEAAIDAVIEAAQKPVEVPAEVKAEPKADAKVEAKADIKAEPKADGKAEATISGSGEKINVPEAKKEPGRAVVSLSKKDENKEAKKATAKAAPKKSTPVVAKLPPQPRLPQPIAAVKAAPVKKAAVRKPVVVAKQTVSIKPARIEIQKPLGSVTPLSAFELGRYQYCGSDRDCTVAVNGCCDCANGGEDVAVNRERFEAFRSRFACLHVACGEQSVEPTCSSGVVSCVNHKCRYFSDAALEEKF